MSANKLVPRWKHIVGYYVLYDKLKKSSKLYIYIYIHSLLVSGQSSMIQIVKPNVPPFADIIHPSPFKFKSLFYFRFLESRMPERFYVPKKVLQIGNSKTTRSRERIAKEREREEKKRSRLPKHT